MNDKRQWPQRPFASKQTGSASPILRRAQTLRERQPAWNAMLNLEVQDHTWLVDWSGGTLEVLCQSPVWLSWLRRNEKKVIKRWNTEFPETPAQQIHASVKPWFARLPAHPEPAKQPKEYADQASLTLREAGKQMPPPIAAALQRLATTLEKAQAGAATKVSANEKGAEPSE